MTTLAPESAQALSPTVAAALGLDAEPLSAPHELVWGERMPARRRDVDVYVRKLRVKLAEAAPGWSFIHTHRQFGYRFHPQCVSSTPPRADS